MESSGTYRLDGGVWIPAEPIPYQWPNWVGRIPSKYLRRLIKKILWRIGS